MARPILVAILLCGGCDMRGAAERATQEDAALVTGGKDQDDEPWCKCRYGCYGNGGYGDCKQKSVLMPPCMYGYWGRNPKTGHPRCNKRCDRHCGDKGQERACNLEDGTCMCMRGYWTHPQDKEQCLRTCEGCRNDCYTDSGVCIIKNNDVCRKGWYGFERRKQLNGRQKLVPTCDKRCDDTCYEDGIEGKCRVDGKCGCGGYSWTDPKDGKQCARTCDHCGTGCYDDGEGDCIALEPKGKSYCKDGWYGISPRDDHYLRCDKQCPAKCMQNGVAGNCKRISGTCDECQGGFWSPPGGPSCSAKCPDECPDGCRADGSC